MDWTAIIITVLVCITIMFIVVEAIEAIREIEVAENEAFKEMCKHTKEDDN